MRNEMLFSVDRVVQRAGRAVVILALDAWLPAAAARVLGIGG